MLVGARAVVLRCAAVRWDRPPLTLTLSPSGERGPFYPVRAWLGPLLMALSDGFEARLGLLLMALSDGFEGRLRLLLMALNDGFEARLRLLLPAISDGCEARLRHGSGAAVLVALKHGLRLVAVGYWLIVTLPLVV
jgi:hypothetical protein